MKATQTTLLRSIQVLLFTTFIFISAYTNKSFAVFNEYTHPDIQTIQTKLIEVNGKFYGTSAQGGTFGYGTVFSFDPTTETFTVLKSFNVTDGETPNVGLNYYNNKLYGAASYGGDNLFGLMFRIDLDGSNYTELYQFADGEPLMDDFVIVNDKFYGTLRYGGASNNGRIFSINPDGTGFTTLHSFGGGPSDGSQAWGGLVYANNKLFGNTVFGGSNDNGVVFSINLDGSSYQVHGHFAANNGNPQAKMVEHQGVLYGVVDAEGEFAAGSLYKVNTDGTGFSEFFSFDCAPSNSACYPVGSLLVYNDIFYGVSSYGANGYAGIYTFDMTGNTYTVLEELDSGTNLSPYWHTGLIAYDGKFWGTAAAGGSGNNGGIYSRSIPDTTVPILQSILPTNSSTITDSTPTISITLDEVGSCRASFTDESYSAMSDNIDCSGDNSTNISCNIPSLGSNGQKNIYIACIDANGNSHTQSNNTLVTYNLQTPDTSTPPDSSDTPVSSADPIPVNSDTENDDQNNSGNEGENEQPQTEEVEIIVIDDNDKPLANTKVIINDVEYTTDQNGKLKLPKTLAASNPTVRIIVGEKEVVGMLTDNKISFDTETPNGIPEDSKDNKGSGLVTWGIVLLVVLPMIIYFFLMARKRDNE